MQKQGEREIKQRAKNNVLASHGNISCTILFRSTKKIVLDSCYKIFFDANFANVLRSILASERKCKRRLNF